MNAPAGDRKETRRQCGRLFALWPWIRGWASPLPRCHLVILLLIVVFGFLRGLFWVAAAQVWNPIDEAQHYAYVESLASGHGMPVVGVDRVSVEVIQVEKVSPTFWFHYEPLQVSIDDPSWGATRESYEGGGVQGPLYYALLVVPYWLSRPFGVLPSIYALRMTSVLVSLLAVPLTWLLARELFPRRPAVWVAAPALLVIVQGFNANLASITNDALVVPAAVAALIPVARAWRGLSLPQAAVGGALFAVAMLTKPTLITLVPMIGVVLVALVLFRREPISKVVRWSIVFGGVAFFIFLPYLAWNLATYGAVSASKEVSAITGPILGEVPFSLEGIHTQFRNARTGFWEFQPYSPGRGTYGAVFEWSAIIALLIGIAATLARRRYHNVGPLVWLAAAFPLAFMTMVTLTYALPDSSGAVGRHYYMALAPLCIVIASGLVIALGARWGTIAVLLVVMLALGTEQGVTRRYIDGVYTSGVIGSSLAPRVDQSWNDEYVSSQAVQVSPPCSVEVLGLGIAGSPPAAVNVAWDSMQQPAQIIGANGNVALYTLQEPLSTAFQIHLPEGTSVGSSRLDREPSVRFADRPGDPMALLYCKSANAKAERFEQRYGPQHPEAITYDRILIWTHAWAWAARLAFGVAVVTAIALEILHWLQRRHRSQAPPAGEP